MFSLFLIWRAFLDLENLNFRLKLNSQCILILSNIYENKLALNKNAVISIILFRSYNVTIICLDLSVSTGCCAALDHIVTYLFTNWQKATKSDNPMKDVSQHPALKILELRSEIFQQVRKCWSDNFFYHLR